MDRRNLTKLTSIVVFPRGRGLLSAIPPAVAATTTLVTTADTQVNSDAADSCRPVLRHQRRNQGEL